MCQARRPRKSPADKQVEAQRDVARIAIALQDALDKQGIELTLASLEKAVTEILLRGVIGVGKQPTIEQPLFGQTTIDQETCEHVWQVGRDDCTKGCGASYVAIHGTPNEMLL